MLTAAAITADFDQLREDLTIPAGATWGRAWPLTHTVDVGGQLVEQPLPIAGWTARAQARDRPPRGVPDEPALVTWSDSPATGQGRLALADGSITLLVADAQSLAWTWRTAWYDVWVRSPAGELAPVAWGQLRVRPAVTRW